MGLTSYPYIEGTSLRPSNEYTSILTVLIESYALVVVVTLGKVISSVVFDIQRPAEIVFSGAHTNCSPKEHGIEIQNIKSRPCNGTGKMMAQIIRPYEFLASSRDDSTT
ncbi:hypothetical protein D9756_002007 [Leucocoprinus leucothites]|uniref:Uncharacterized protein n=1 Tax=Leucocoprinus leucothites TaxID=201217 RepID=A0A8H5LM80_9AGAR|nr:hypothetical protein D9756_002007 [Leucoagaricus leucothites]